MRLSTKLGASLSAAALGSAVVLGGAGVAQAQSAGSLGDSGSLGSSDLAPVALTVSGDLEEVGGTITNNTEAALDCSVLTTNAEVIEAIQDDFGGDTGLDEAIEANQAGIDAATEVGQTGVWGFPAPLGAGPIEVGADSDAEWTGAGYGPEEDFRSGAVAQCGDEVAFAYEPTDGSGSLDMGSLDS